MNYSFTCQNLSYAYKQNYILKNINFNFQPGQIVCLLGNNGSGKSTLLKICAGVLIAQSGRVCVNENNILDLSEDERTQLIGWQPQNITRPFHLDLIDFMEISNRIQNNSGNDLFEINSFLQKPISTLSGGEWKRGQLARLWQSNCKILLLDEPDSDLDLRHKKKLVQFCKKYAHENNAILLIATHDILFAQEVANQICALSQGYLVWNSSSEDFWRTKVINKIFSTRVF